MRKNKTFSVMVEIRSGKASLNASYSMLFSVTHRVKCNNAGVCHLLLYGRHLQKCRFQKSTGLIKAIPKNRMIGLLILVFRFSRTAIIVAMTTGVLPKMIVMLSGNWLNADED